MSADSLPPAAEVFLSLLGTEFILWSSAPIPPAAEVTAALDNGSRCLVNVRQQVDRATYIEWRATNGLPRLSFPLSALYFYEAWADCVAFVQPSDAAGWDRGAACRNCGLPLPANGVCPEIACQALGWEYDVRPGLLEDGAPEANEK